MSAPFAEYELTERPAGVEVSLPLGARWVLDPRRKVYVSRYPTDEISVQPTADLGWGGRRNHLIDFHEQRWQVHHLGHSLPIAVNGVPWRGLRRPLLHGDRVEPATGLVFTFFELDALEPLAAELAHCREAVLMDERVLLDWILERRAVTAVEAARISLHLRYRLAHAGAL